MDNTAAGILARLKAEIPEKYDKTVGSYIHDILAPPAIELESVYQTIDQTGSRMMISTASGTDLDAVLEQFGYSRKQATYAYGEVIVSGASDAVIRAGDLVAGGKEVYEILDTAELIGGTASVRVRAQIPGSSGNAAAGTVNYFPVSISKITSVTNPEPISGGTDAETDAEYRERYMYFLDHPVTTGNKYEYEQWAREVDGVGLAKCYPLHNGPGTVKVVIATAEMEPAGAELVENVTAYIDEKRPIGADVKVTSAIKVDINVTATVNYDASYSLQSIQLEFTKTLDEYLKTIGFSGGILPYTKIGSILQQTSGVIFYSNLLVNGSTNNISIEDGSLAVVGGVSLA